MLSSLEIDLLMVSFEKPMKEVSGFLAALSVAYGVPYYREWFPQVCTDSPFDLLLQRCVLLGRPPTLRTGGHRYVA